MIWRITLRDMRKSWKRSLTVIGAVALSVFLLEFGAGYMDGFRDKLYNQSIRESGHIRFTAHGYSDKLDLMPLKPNTAFGSGLDDSLKALPEVKLVRPAIRSGGLVNTPDRNLTMQIFAAPPQVQADIYQRLKGTVASGKFMDGDNQVMMGTEAARLLHVQAGDRVIVLTTDSYGGMSAVEPAVAGIFHSYNADENASLLLMDLTGAQKLLAMPGRVTEVTLELNSRTDLDRAYTAAKRLFDDRYDITTWQTDQAGWLALLKISDIGMAVLATIIVTVAALGMINTFLLSVLERMPDFGTLRAIGLMPAQLISMILLQGLLLGVAGTVLGMATAIPVVLYFQGHPVDFGEAMASVKGVDSLIGMSFQGGTAAWICALGVGIAVLACLYPAIHASRVRPVTILRNLA